MIASSISTSYEPSSKGKKKQRLLWGWITIEIPINQSSSPKFRKSRWRTQRRVTTSNVAIAVIDHITAIIVGPLPPVEAGSLSGLAILSHTLLPTWDYHRELLQEVQIIIKAFVKRPSSFSRIHVNKGVPCHVNNPLGPRPLFLEAPLGKSPDALSRPT